LPERAKKKGGYVMARNWGPRFIVPSEKLGSYSGTILLREDLNKEDLRRELEDLGILGSINKISNPWYFRQKGHESWIKIGESHDEQANFPVRWDTSNLKNGQYEVMGFMHVFLEKEGQTTAIARSNIVEITVEN
jgi:hypothetical protein